MIRITASNLGLAVTVGLKSLCLRLLMMIPETKRSSAHTLSQTLCELTPHTQSETHKVSVSLRWKSKRDKRESAEEIREKG